MASIEESKVPGRVARALVSVLAAVSGTPSPSTAESPKARIENRAPESHSPSDTSVSVAFLPRGPDGRRQWGLCVPSNIHGTVPLALARLPELFKDRPEVEGFYYESWTAALRAHSADVVGRAMLDYYVDYGNEVTRSKLNGREYLSPANVACAVLMKAFTNLEFQSEVRFSSPRARMTALSGDAHERKIQLNKSQVDFLVSKPDSFILEYCPTVYSQDGKLVFRQQQRYFKRVKKAKFEDTAENEEAEFRFRSRSARQPSNYRPQDSYKRTLREFQALKEAEEAGKLGEHAFRRRLARLCETLARAYRNLRQSQLAGSNLDGIELNIATNPWEFRRIIEPFFRPEFSGEIPRGRTFRVLFEGLHDRALERFNDYRKSV